MFAWPPRPRQPLSGLALAAAGGIAAADLWAIPALLTLAVLLLVGIVLAIRPRSMLCWLFAALAFFSLHTYRHHGSAALRLAKDFAPGPVAVWATGIVISEPSPPAEGSRWLKAAFRVRLEHIEYKGITSKPGNGVEVRWAGPIPAYGDRISVRAAAQNLEPVRNPGQPDFARYLQRQGIYSVLESRYATDCQILSSGHGNRIMAFAQSSRRWMQRQLQIDLEDAPHISAVIASMVLGARGDTPDDVKELFRRTGTLHLFAVSGLNVAMLAGIVLFCLKQVRVPRRAAVYIVLPVLVLYALTTGLTPSCVRATIMGAALLVGLLVERPSVPYNSLAAAALAILAWDTNQLFSPGFQLSFAIVFTLLLLGRRFQHILEPYGQPDPFLPRVLWSWPHRAQSSVARCLAGTVAVTLASWLGSLLFTIGYFHLISPSAILANVVAVPLAAAILALGLGTVLTAPLSTAIGSLFNNANWAFATTLLGVVQFFAAVPGGHSYVEAPRFLPPPPVAEFTVLDVRAGGAVHFRIGGEDWLMDTGPAFAYERAVLPYLRSRGIDRLTGLLLTHGDTQHVGGAVAVLADLRPGIIGDSSIRDRSRTRKSLHEALARSGRGKRLLQRGDEVLVPGGRFRVLYPPAGLRKNTADDKALVVMLHAAGSRALFLSDSGFSTEQWLVQNEPDLQADILVKGWHGRDLSGTSDFLGKVRPSAVICAAPDFGKPVTTLDAWTSAATANGLTVFRQDITGAVRVDLLPERFRLTPTLGNKTPVDFPSTQTGPGATH